MMKKTTQLISFALVFLFSSLSFAQSNIFTNNSFDDEDFRRISKDLASSFVHTTNSGGSSLGSVFGFEVGLVFGGVESKYLKDQAEEITGEEQDQFQYLPYAGLIAGVSLPAGIGAEASVIPKVQIGDDDGEFSNYSGSLRWTVTDIIPIVGTFSPLKITAKASYNETSLYYTYDGSGTSTETADFSISNFEYGAVVGVNLVVVEPYVGVTHVKTSSKLDATTDYVSPLPGLVIEDQHFEADLEGTRIQAGVLLKLALFRFGLELSNLQGVNRYTAKLSLKF